jgi:hypothetical protein
MSEYRLYCLNGEGRFSKSHDIIAETDEEAVGKAGELKLPVKCELWRQGHLVATLSPHEAERHAH